MISNKEKNFVSLVVYVHNAEKTIESFLHIVDEELKNNFDKYEIICVNDASTDKSVNLIEKYAANNICGTISIINMSFVQGVEASMNAGIDLAIGDFIFEMDDTVIDYRKDMIMEAYRRSLTGYDIVSVAPKNNRNGVSSCFYYIYNAVSHTKNNLRTETFRVVSRRGINRIRSLNKNIPYRKPVYANCGLPVDCLLYEIEPGISDTHKNTENRLDTAINSLVLFTDIAYKVSVWFALLMMLGAVCGGGYVVMVYFGNMRPMEGWTTTMMFLAMGFSAVFALFAVVIKYLSIMMNMIFQKQSYLIDSIQKYGK